MRGGKEKETKKKREIEGKRGELGKKLKCGVCPLF